MITNQKAIRPGAILTDPIGRHIVVQEVFVPKNQQSRSACLPASFRQVGRKVIVFQSGAIAHFADIAKRYTLNNPGPVPHANHEHV